MKNTSLLLLYFNSIKVRLEQCPYCLKMRSDEYFNSIKVRLEPTDEIDDVLLLLHFNSIKVRLELDSRLIFLCDFTLFQFHKGAIRT